MAALAGNGTPAYLIEDMADDAAAMLEALGIQSAHVLGVSMGGMIAQAVAIRHAARVRTLISIMSTTGDRSVGQPHPEAVAALLVPPPTAREEVIERAVKMSGIIGSPGIEVDLDRVAAAAGAAFDRTFYPVGVARQLVAITASPDRTPALKELSVPTLVIHGNDDPLVDPTGGRATAAAIPGAEFWGIPGMGHDLPDQLFGQIADRVAAHCGL
jgi:pimeloyl-ACP methyl ester carboxylesterase